MDALTPKAAQFTCTRTMCTLLTAPPLAQRGGACLKRKKPTTTRAKRYLSTDQPATRSRSLLSSSAAEAGSTGQSAASRGTGVVNTRTRDPTNSKHDGHAPYGRQVKRGTQEAEADKHEHEESAQTERAGELRRRRAPWRKKIFFFFRWKGPSITPSGTRASFACSAPFPRSSFVALRISPLCLARAAWPLRPVPCFAA